MSVSLSIIIPVYNEVNTIKEIIRRVQNVDIKKEIIIVDDGSTDGTREILRGMGGDDLTVLYHERNMGKGAAIRTGLKHISNDIVIIQDADLEYNPQDYHILIKPILEGNADVVYGSRFLGPHRAFLFWHYAGNKFLTLVTNILYDTILTDMETGYKAFKAAVFKDIEIRSNGFDFEPEITSKVLKRGHRVFEVPISYSGRDYSEGKKISWKDGFSALAALIRYRFTE